MKYKGIVFDLDGVLCRTDRYHYLAWRKIADGLGIPFGEETNNRLRGVGRMASLEILLEEYPGTLTQEEKEGLAEEKNRLYREMLTEITPADLSEEVMGTLKYLRACGYLLAVGSSSRNAGFILERLGLQGYFDVVVDGSRISASKPEPEVFLKAAAELSLPPSACLVVEDARAGIDAAVAGGFESAGIGEAAEYGRTDFPLTKLSDLLKICEENKP